MTVTTKKISKSELLNKLKPVKKEIPSPAIPAPVKIVNHGKVVNYYVEYEDGSVHLAQGAHAHLVYRFTMEAQKLATMHAFAYYEGPGMLEMTKQEALDLIKEK